MNVNVRYKAKWQHKQFNHYVWTECKKLINLKSGKEVKKAIKNQVVGYWLNRKFVSVESLKSQIQLINKINCTF